MMRLRKLSTGTWTVLAEVRDDGSCELHDDLEALLADPKTTRTAAGFYSLWSLIPNEGPRKLGTDKYHQLDATHEIYEFIKRGHRILCFAVDGRIVVCSHLMKKVSQKVRKGEIARAIELRRAYLAAEAAGDLEIC